VIIKRHYDEVKVGDYVRTPDWPVTHEVVRVEQAVGLVQLEVGVGGMIERLPPRPAHELIETERPG
jgi:hypothetical protein